MNSISVPEKELVSITNYPFAWTKEIVAYLAACGMPVSKELDLDYKYYYYSRSYCVDVGKVRYSWRAK